MEFNLYNPHANQIKIHESGAKYRVLSAGRRFGKSALGLNEALARAFQLRDQIIWIVLPQFRQAKEIYWIDPDITRYFMPYVTAGLIKADKSELSLHVLSTNSWIRLKGSDNYDSLRGSGIDLIIWDEAADVKPEAFETIKPSLADSPNHRVLYIGTPKGLNWFHDFALRGDHERKIASYGKAIEPDKDWATWQFTSYDNLSWPIGSHAQKTFTEYIDKQRQEADEKGKLAFFNQEYMASFEESAGRFFPKWDYRTHTVAPFVPSLEYKRWGTMDWGRAAPFAWYAHVTVPVNYEGIKFNRVYTFSEVYDTGKSPYEQAEQIAATIDYTTLERTYYDPSMKIPQNDGSLSVADQFTRAFERITGKYARFIPASNKRVSRWAAMDNWMRMAPDRHPYWIITQNCKNLIRTIPLMSPDKNNIEDIDTSLEDHAVDSAGYGLQYVDWIDGRAVGGITRTKQKPKATTAWIDPDNKEQMPIDLEKFEDKRFHAKPRSL